MNTQRFTPKGESSVNTGYSRGNDDERTVTNRDSPHAGPHDRKRAHDVVSE